MPGAVQPQLGVLAQSPSPACASLCSALKTVDRVTGGKGVADRDGPMPDLSDKSDKSGIGPSRSLWQ